MNVVPIVCMSCGQRGHMSGQRLAAIAVSGEGCPHCGSQDLDLDGGQKVAVRKTALGRWFVASDDTKNLGEITWGFRQELRPEPGMFPCLSPNTDQTFFCSLAEGTVKRWGMQCPRVKVQRVDTVVIEGAIWGVPGEELHGDFCVNPDAVPDIQQVIAFNTKTASQTLSREATLNATHAAVAQSYLPRKTAAPEGWTTGEGANSDILIRFYSDLIVGAIDTTDMSWSVDEYGTGGRGSIREGTATDIGDAKHKCDQAASEVNAFGTGRTSAIAQDILATNPGLPLPTVQRLASKVASRYLEAPRA